MSWKGEAVRAPKKAWASVGRWRVLAAAVLLLLVGCSQTAPHPVASHPMEGAELGDVLRGGGYVVFLRHSTTDTASDQGTPPEVTDCGRQRNLSSAGRQQAERLGDDLRTVGVAVGTVLASPFCRTIETAELAFGRVEEDDRLLQADSEQAAADLGELLSEPPSRGNTWLVGHVSNIGAAVDLHIDEGEAAVFAPGGEGEYTLVATVPAEAWDELGGPD